MNPSALAESESAIQPALWGRYVLEAIYSGKITVTPVDTPSYTTADHWWHLVFPFEVGQATLDLALRKSVDAALDRVADQCLARRKHLLLIGARTGPTHAEVLVNGAFDDRRWLKARLRSAICRAQRSVSGEPLRWRLAWGALLETPEALRLAAERFRLTGPLEAPTSWAGCQGERSRCHPHGRPQ